MLAAAAGAPVPVAAQASPECGEPGVRPAGGATSPESGGAVRTEATLR
jgi:hypothetical protein